MSDLKPEIAALVLAAGSSTRLGQCKQLLPVQGETLVHRSARLAVNCCPGPVMCVLGAQANLVAAALADLPVEYCINRQWQTGMASSVHCGLAALPETVDGVMVLVCDQYRLVDGDLKKLLAAWRADAIVAACYAGVTGVPAIFPRCFFGQLGDLSGDQGARRLLRYACNSTIAIELPNAAFDIDTPADLLDLTGQ